MLLGVSVNKDPIMCPPYAARTVVWRMSKFDRHSFGYETILLVSAHGLKTQKPGEPGNPLIDRCIFRITLVVHETTLNTTETN